MTWRGAADQTLSNCETCARSNAPRTVASGAGRLGTAPSTQPVGQSHLHVGPVFTARVVVSLC